jgi:hypothetical protein
MEQTFHAVECTHCRRRMTEHRGSGGRVQYFRCGSCHRWMSSSYAEVLAGDAAFQKRDDDAPDEKFEAVKNRLELWLAALDKQDPYRVLGVSPYDTAEAIKKRYRELALEKHPDRGGSADAMRELNAAYEQVTRHRERAGVTGEAVPAQAALPTTGSVSRRPFRYGSPLAASAR